MSRKRDKPKLIYLSEQENELLEEASKRTGLNQSTLIRTLILGYAPREKPDEQFYMYMRMLSGLSNRVNQLAIKSHTYDYIDTEELNDLAKSIKELRIQILDKYLNREKEAIALWQQPDFGK